MSEKNSKYDLDFHIAIAKACHNTILTDMYESIAGYLESQIAERNKESSLSSDEIDSLHETLYKAVFNRQPEQAAAAVAKW